MKLRKEFKEIALKLQREYDKQKGSNERFKKEFGSEYEELKLSRLTVFFNCIQKNGGYLVVDGEKKYYDSKHTTMYNILLP